MTQLSALYRYAWQHRIQVDWVPMSRAESLSLPLGDGTCAVAINPRTLRGITDETVKLAHEIGHCETGSFYCRDAPLDERGRCETRANRWVYRHLLPFPDLQKAIKQGCREPWALAERFEVSEDVVRGALAFYTGPCGLTI